VVQFSVIRWFGDSVFSKGSTTIAGLALIDQISFPFLQLA
jgi:hypothetical protein